MNNLAHTVEDCLEILTGLKSVDSRFKIDPSDAAILNSIARQVYRGTALTDRQHNLVKEKLLAYEAQFENNGVENLSSKLNNIRLPIREIDRSKTVTVVDFLPNTPTESKDKTKYLKIRFPFNKKTIAALEKITDKYRRSYYHERGTHEHYFVFKESIVYDVVETFQDRNFEIDNDVVDFYKKIKTIKENPSEHIDCISNGETFKIKNKIPNNLNYYQTIDRHRRYGLVNFDTVNDDSLIGEIVNRGSCEFLCSPDKWTMQQTVEAVYSLDRFPMVVLLDYKNAEDQIFEIWSELKNIVSNEEQSVLFRQDGDTEFNRFIKQKGLNNWVDSNTKVVYIDTNKLPKLLLDSDFKPITAINFGGMMNRFVDAYLVNNCDLNITRDRDLSPFRRYSNYYI